MSITTKILLLGLVLIFGTTACSPSGFQEQELEGDVATEIPSSPGIDAGSLEAQGTKDNSPPAKNSRNYDDLEIITLLPRDAIPAIDDPQFLSASQADEEYAPDELVIGVNYDGDARAYSIPYLSGREIVNDTVGGRKIAVTW